MRSKVSGFTLFEMAFAMLIVAIMTMSAWAAFTRINSRAQASAYVNDCRVFSEAFNRYAQEHGSYPGHQAALNGFPPEMSGYLSNTNWTRKTPLGGHYDWDDKDATNSLGVTFSGAIKVTGCTWTLDNLRNLDTWFDDGGLVTGNIRVTDAGTTVFFVMEVAR
jgi:type II secretory pathway pseudopilin PulG